MAAGSMLMSSGILTRPWHEPVDKPANIAMQPSSGAPPCRVTWRSAMLLAADRLLVRRRTARFR